MKITFFVFSCQVWYKSLTVLCPLHYFDCMRDCNHAVSLFLLCFWPKWMLHWQGNLTQISGDLFLTNNSNNWCLWSLNRGFNPIYMCCYVVYCTVSEKKLLWQTTELGIPQNMMAVVHGGYAFHIWFFCSPKAQCISSNLPGLFFITIVDESDQVVLTDAPIPQM